MIKIKERKKVKIFIPSLNKEYELSKPTFGEQESYQDSLASMQEGKSGAGSAFGPMIKYLASMGIPEADVKKLDTDEYVEIIEAMNGSKKNLVEEPLS